MQTLVFNSTEKYVTLYGGWPAETGYIEQIYNVPTVKTAEGYYEVIQKDADEKNYPVLRVPISNTIMKIIR